MRTDNPTLLRRYRGGELESLQRGAWVRIELGRGVTDGAGDPEQWIFGRSATKSLQAVALVESGAAAAFGFDDRHLALAMASHSGEVDHVSVALDGLAKLGLDSSALGCGLQRPLAAAITEPATAPSHNCSGKHVGFLAVCRHLGQDPASYLDPEGPTQQLVVESVSAMVGRDDLGIAVDGCSAPTFRLPLSALAVGLAQVATPDNLPPQRSQACTALVAAQRRHPHLIGGTNRFCTELIAATDGALVAKAGAEAVYAIGVVGTGIGYAVKLDDGNMDSVYPVVTALLARDGHLSDDQLGKLGGWSDHRLKNAAGQVVGHMDFPAI